MSIGLLTKNNYARCNIYTSVALFAFLCAQMTAIGLSIWLTSLEELELYTYADMLSAGCTVLFLLVQFGIMLL